MVIAKSNNNNKTYYKDLYGKRACIVQQIDGAAKLIITNSKGEIIYNKLYKHRQGALHAWDILSSDKYLEN